MIYETQSTLKPFSFLGDDIYGRDDLNSRISKLLTD